MLETIVGFLGVAFVGCFGWTVQLGNRVSVIETRQQDLPTLINSQFAEINRRLERIERNQNGKHLEKD